MKKQKTAATTAIVKEIHAGLSNSRLYLYQVEWLGNIYFLDKFLELVGQEPATGAITLIDVDETNIFYVDDLEYAPLFADIQRARGKLGKGLVDAFVSVYAEHFWTDVKILLKMGIRPCENNKGDPIYLSALGIVPLLLLSLYMDTARDLYLSWTYEFLRQHKSYRWRDCSRVHYLSRVLCWKGKLEWLFSVPRPLQQLHHGETRGLTLLAMARNRPAGESVFAQLPRDLMKMIFDWIQWSLPLEL